MKLRQAALHPLLVKTNDAEDDLADEESGGFSLAELKAQFTNVNGESFQSKAFQEFVQAQKDGEPTECPICMDEVRDLLRLQQSARD